MGSNYFVGILLVLLGAGFLLDQFTIINFSEILSVYWPSILILWGLSGIFNKRASKFGNTIVILIGVFFQLDRLDLINFNVFTIIWPVILILVGLRIVFSSRSINNGTTNSNMFGWSNENVSLEDSIDAFVIMSGLETNNQSQQFQGGRATAIFGGIDLDLRGAKLKNEETYMELNAMFGGIDIFVPQEWRVEVTGFPVFGGWSNKTRINTDPNAPILRIKCFVMFGGIEIK
ncbi:cell wall-active antibiotics response protein [Tissierella sp. MSJ-40]|uniref:Cell wall-active antibiotics response protein n=1 Tax=Tissierella simiarum TaxID=2841534 RepID=A0ABS6EB71_9FIRM|nr:DUF5668 domain-containing protein [Tissierella simiarum]MBU5440178.1 cell wall-active antibiotics response protein [Tissierella simiarum]